MEKFCEGRLTERNRGKVSQKDPGEESSRPRQRRENRSEHWSQSKILQAACTRVTRSPTPPAKPSPRRLHKPKTRERVRWLTRENPELGPAGGCRKGFGFRTPGGQRRPHEANRI